MDKKSPLVQKKQLILGDLNKQILLPLKSNKIVNHMMTKKIKVLMTGAGAPGGPEIIQAIKRIAKLIYILQMLTPMPQVGSYVTNVLFIKYQTLMIIILLIIY